MSTSCLPPQGRPQSRRVAPASTICWRGARCPSAQQMLIVSLWAVGFMWVLPFLLPFKAPPVPSFWAEAAAVGLGLVALSAWALWARGLVFPRVAWLPLSFVALLLLQLFLGRVAYYQQAILAALYLLWACALIVLGGVFRRELGLMRIARHAGLVPVRRWLAQRNYRTGAAPGKLWPPGALHYRCLRQPRLGQSCPSQPSCRLS